LLTYGATALRSETRCPIGSGVKSVLNVSLSAHNWVAGRALVMAVFVAANQVASWLVVACPAPTPSCRAMTSMGAVARILCHMVVHWLLVWPPLVLKNGLIITGLPGVRACRWFAMVV